MVLAKAVVLYLEASSGLGLEALVESEITFLR